MIRSYYYRVSYHDDSQSAGSVMRQPMRAKVSCGEQSQSRVAKHSDGKHHGNDDSQTNKATKKHENDLRRLEQCHEQSQRVLDAVRKASR